MIPSVDGVITKVGGRDRRLGGGRVLETRGERWGRARAIACARCAVSGVRTCPRCGAPVGVDDTLCRRCGVDLPAPSPSPSPGAAMGLPPLKPRLQLAWLLGGVVAYLLLLLLGFQFFADSFRAYAAVLGEIKSLADIAKHERALTELFWRVIALVGVSYATSAVLLGRFTPGRPVLQATLAAALSWVGISWRATALAPAAGASALLPMLVGGAFVALVALAASAFGAWLRPSRPSGGSGGT